MPPPVVAGGAMPRGPQRGEPVRGPVAVLRGDLVQEVSRRGGREADWTRRGYSAMYTARGAGKGWYGMGWG